MSGKSAPAGLCLVKSRSRRYLYLQKFGFIVQPKSPQPAREGRIARRHKPRAGRVRQNRVVLAASAIFPARGMKEAIAAQGFLQSRWSRTGCPGEPSGNGIARCLSGSSLIWRDIIEAGDEKVRAAQAEQSRNLELKLVELQAALKLRVAEDHKVSVKLAEHDIALAELRHATRSDQAKVIDVPNPLQRRRGLNS